MTSKLPGKGAYTGRLASSRPGLVINLHWRVARAMFAPCSTGTPSVVTQPFGYL
jgi:hypothetical protein